LKANEVGLESINFEANKCVGKVFSQIEETSVHDYFIEASKHNFRFTRKDARVFAFDFAVANKKTYPLS
jgi:hypothetical protein